MITKTEISAATLAAALALLAEPASAQMMQGENMMGAKEQCYGVAVKGPNDCGSKGVNSCAGQSKTDHEGTAWKYVPKGTCESMKAPHGMGSLHPTKA